MPKRGTSVAKAVVRAWQAETQDERLDREPACRVSAAAERRDDRDLVAPAHVRVERAHERPRDPHAHVLADRAVLVDDAEAEPWEAPVEVGEHLAQRRARRLDLALPARVGEER